MAQFVTVSNDAVWHSHTAYLVAVAVFQQIMHPELDARPNWAPGLTLTEDRLIISKHAVKDCPILKGEDTPAMLLF